MTITYELDLNNFEAWSGAISTLDRIIAEGKVDELDNLLTESYPEGMSETELNDILWFDEDWIFDCLGIRSESVIREELEEAQAELAEIYKNIEKDFEMELFDMATEKEYQSVLYDEEEQTIDEEEKQERYAYVVEQYEDDIAELKEKIVELEAELENI